MRVRSISRVHRLADGNTVIVRLAVSEEHLWHEFWEMVTVLGVGLPVIVILVALTGYLVAARALKAVDSMTQRAAQITAEQLNERLHIENPNDELAQLGSPFNNTLARLERSFDQLRRFTPDASHELRTPLTAYTECRRSIPEDARRRELLPGQDREHARGDESSHAISRQPADDGSR